MKEVCFFICIAGKETLLRRKKNEESLSFDRDFFFRTICPLFLFLNTSLASAGRVRGGGCETYGVSKFSRNEICATTDDEAAVAQW